MAYINFVKTLVGFTTDEILKLPLHLINLDVNKDGFHGMVYSHGRIAVCREIYPFHGGRRAFLIDFYQREWSMSSFNQFQDHSVVSYGSIVAAGPVTH